MAVHHDNKVHGQSGSRVLRFPGSGIWVPCRHGWIFMAAQVWAWDVTGIGAREFFQTAGVAGMAGAWFIWVASVAGTVGVGCMHCTGGGNAGCATEKWCPVRA